MDVARISIRGRGNYNKIIKIPIIIILIIKSKIIKSG